MADKQTLSNGSLPMESSEPRKRNHHRKYDTVDKILLYLGGAIVTLGVSFMSITYQSKLEGWDKLLSLVEKIQINQAAEIEREKLHIFRIETNESEIKLLKGGMHSIRKDIQSSIQDSRDFRGEVRGYWKSRPHNLAN